MPPFTPGPSQQAMRRLLKEHASIQAEAGGRHANPDVLELRPWDVDGGDLFEWYARVKGVGEGYEGGAFELSIQIPSNYPIAPPVMHFRTRVFHPNIHWKTGEVCLDVLKSQWSPAWTLSSACTAVVALLESPEASSPLNVDAANLLRTGDMVAYNSLVRMYTQLYAMPSTK